MKLTLLGSVCGFVILLSCILYLKRPGGITLRFTDSSTEAEVPNKIQQLQGSYYYKRVCKVNSPERESDEVLPFGCFEGALPLYSKTSPGEVTSVPDLSQLYALVKTAAAKSQSSRNVKIFEVQFDEKHHIWYVTRNNDVLATYVGPKSGEPNTPPSLVAEGWNIEILNRQTFEIELFGQVNKGLVTDIDLSTPTSSALYDKLRKASAEQSSAFVNDLALFPQTLIIISFCVLYWAYIRYHEVPSSAVGISYNSIILRGEYQRIFTASFAHLDFFHLLMNMASLYSVGRIEVIVGPVLYFNYTIIMLVGSMLIGLVIQHYLINRRNMEIYRESVAVGFSCVLFGWLVIFANSQSIYCPIPIFPQVFGRFCFPTWSLINFGIIDLKINLGPLVLLGVIQIFLPKASLVGHLSGILIGLCTSMGLFRYVNMTTWMIGLLYLYLWYSSTNTQTRNRADAVNEDQVLAAHYEIKKWMLVRVIVVGCFFFFASISLWFEMAFNCLVLLMTCIRYIFPTDTFHQSRRTTNMKHFRLLLFIDVVYWVGHFILVLRNLFVIPLFYNNIAKLPLYAICLSGYCWSSYQLISLFVP